MGGREERGTDIRASPCMGSEHAVASAVECKSNTGTVPVAMVTVLVSCNLDS